MKQLFEKFFSLFKNEKNKKLEIRKFLPEDFLNSFLCNFIYYKGAFLYINKDWKVLRCYFAGGTLCLDVENEKLQFKDVITICKNNTFGFFTNCDIYKRSKLSLEEINKINIIKENFL